jgi:TolA-binding protein
MKSKAMKRKPKVTQTVVSAACEQLQAAGKNATVNAVIGITGGSFSTVGVMLKAWRAEQVAQAVPLLQMPDTVAKAMHKATADIWAVASNLAGEAVERTRHEAGEGIAKAQAELSEYAGEVARLEGELESSRKTSVVAKDRLAETLLQVSELTAQKAALSARLDDRNGELERLQANYDKLQAELLVMAKAGSRVGEGEKAGQ